MRTIGVVTGSRSEYGIYLPILRRIAAAPELRPALYVTGSHLDAQFGNTVSEIEADGFPIAARIPVVLSGDTPQDTARSMALAISGFAEAFAQQRPDLLLLLGDRYEMAAAALAALPLKIPLAHIHGGELTQGAIDDALRHCITKLSHLHFAATAQYAQRIIQMGEEPWRVMVSGAPSLDNLRQLRLLTRDELNTRFGLQLEAEFLLVTYHPVTLEYEQLESQVAELLSALDLAALPLLFTAPNADHGGRAILRAIRQYAATHPRAWLVDNLGTQAYFSAMALSTAMVGNSSSGLVEAASFQLPVVNIGSRQEGRVRGANVIDVGCSRQEILAGIRRARSEEFRDSLRNLVNPYGLGHAADIIVERLKTVSLDDRLLRKRFCDLPFPKAADGAGSGP